MYLGVVQLQGRGTAEGSAAVLGAQPQCASHYFNSVKCWDRSCSESKDSSSGKTLEEKLQVKHTCKTVIVRINTTCSVETESEAGWWVSHDRGVTLAPNCAYHTRCKGAGQHAPTARDSTTAVTGDAAGPSRAAHTGNRRNKIKVKFIY